jgi:hypothetical protein
VVDSSGPTAADWLLLALGLLSGLGSSRLPWQREQPTAQCGGATVVPRQAITPHTAFAPPSLPIRRVRRVSRPGDGTCADFAFHTSQPVQPRFTSTTCASSRDHLPRFSNMYSSSSPRHHHPSTHTYASPPEYRNPALANGSSPALDPDHHDPRHPKTTLGYICLPIPRPSSPT